MVTQKAGADDPAPPRRPGAGLASFAVLTVDAAGLVTSWSVTAARLLGRTAGEMTGQHLGDVLLNRPGQRELLQQALAEVGAGRSWTATVDLAFSRADGPATMHCEPAPGGSPAGPGGALVIIQRPPAAPARPGPDLLSEAATRIGTTLDLTRTAREVTEVAVPAFAAAATIFVSEPLLAADDVAARRAGSAAVVRRLAARLAGQPPAVTDSVLRPGEVLVFDGASPSFRAMSTGQPVRSDHLGQETVDRLTRRPGGHQIAAGYTRFLAVPLAARGLVLGCATFARAPRDPGFEPDDIALAAELAARAAVCIDNARLYDRERRTAFALQHGLLPREPRIPAGMEVAHRYFPVGASVVGGDWHDIVRLPGGRAALIVGDAMGHGPEAAAVMVQLRTAAHTLASLDLPAEDILHRLDRMAAGMPAAPFATCIYAVIDPERNSCVIAKAGHPPPLLARPGRAPEVLDLPPGLPLGLGTGSFEAAEVSLPAGTTLALYTDGLVESRIRPLDEGIAALGAALGPALAPPGGPLDTGCEMVTQALRQRGDDDITLVLARIRPGVSGAR